MKCCNDLQKHLTQRLTASAHASLFELCRAPFALTALRGCATRSHRRSVVPLAGIEPALLAESDFESDASTSSATGATRVLYSGGCRGFPVPDFDYLQV